MIRRRTSVNKYRNSFAYLAKTCRNTRPNLRDDACSIATCNGPQNAFPINVLPCSTLSSPQTVGDAKIHHLQSVGFCAAATILTSTSPSFTVGTSTSANPTLPLSSITTAFILEQVIRGKEMWRGLNSRSRQYHAELRHARHCIIGPDRALGFAIHRDPLAAISYQIGSLGR